MKTKIFTQLMTVLLLAVGSIFAQTPQGINYQAVVRNGSGTIANSAPVTFRFSFHEGSASGTVKYSETIATTTDGYGMANVVLGTGTTVSGSFSAVNWSLLNYLQTEVNLTGAFVNLGTTKFQSVPYALNAGGGGGWTTSGSNIYNSNSGNVGIGTNSPDQKLHVKTSSGYFHFQSLGTESTFQMQNSASTGYISLGGWNMGTSKFGVGSNTTPRFVVDVSDGHVGIGTATSAYNLVVHGNGNVAQSQVVADADHFIHQYSGSTGDNDAAIVVDNGQALRFGTWSDAGSTGWKESLRISPDAGNGGGKWNFALWTNSSDPLLTSIDNFGVLGDASTKLYRIYASTYYGVNTSIQAISDRRMKTNVQNYADGMNTLMKLRPVRYDFIPEKLYPTEAARAKADPKDLSNQIGFIAQEVEEVLPGLIRDMKMDDGTVLKTLGYTGLVPVMVQGMQEQQTQIEALTAQIEALKAEIAAMKK